MKEVKKMDWLTKGTNHHVITRKEQTFSRNLVKDFISTKGLGLVSGSVSYFSFVCSVCVAGREAVICTLLGLLPVHVHLRGCQRSTAQVFLYFSPPYFMKFNNLVT